MARGGIEPPTYRFSGGRSYQLSYLAVPPEHARIGTRRSLPDPVRPELPLPRSGSAQCLVVTRQHQRDQRRMNADRIGHERDPGGRGT